MEADAFFEDFEVEVGDFFEDLGVNLSHHFGGDHGLAVGWGEVEFGLMVEGFGAVVLTLHEGAEAVIVVVIEDLLFGDAEVAEVFEGEVDAAGVAGVLADIAKDVGELEGVAEMEGVFLGVGMAVAEDFDADEADDGGDLVAVMEEFFEGLEAGAAEVAGDAVDEFGEEGGIEVVFGGEGEDFVEEGIGAGGAVKDGVFPGLELGFSLGDGVGFFVCDVVDDAAEGVEGDHVPAAFGGEGEEGEGEIGPGALGDFSGGGGAAGHARRAVEVRER